MSKLKSKVGQVEKIANDANSDINKLQHELNTFKQQHKKLEEYVINIESQSRRNNLDILNYIFLIFITIKYVMKTAEKIVNKSIKENRLPLKVSSLR